MVKRLPKKLEIKLFRTAADDYEALRPFVKVPKGSKTWLRADLFELMVDMIEAQAARIKELETEKARK